MTQKVVQGQKAQKPADPVKAGYRFDGWYQQGAAFDFDTAIVSDLTLTAK